LKKKIYNSKTRKNRKFLRRSTVKRNKIGGSNSNKTLYVNSDGPAFNTRSEIDITDEEIEAITNPVRVSIYEALESMLEKKNIKKKFTKTRDKKGDGKFYISRNTTIQSTSKGAIARPHIHYKDNVFCGFPTGNDNKFPQGQEYTTYKIAVDKLSDWKNDLLHGQYFYSTDTKTDWLELIGEIRNDIFDQMLTRLQLHEIGNNDEMINIVKVIKKRRRKYEIVEKGLRFNKIQTDIKTFIETIKDKNAKAYFIFGTAGINKQGTPLTKADLCQPFMKKIVQIELLNETQLTFDEQYILDKYDIAENLLDQLNELKIFCESIQAYDLIEKNNYIKQFNKDFEGDNAEDIIDAFILFCLYLWCSDKNKFTNKDNNYINNIIESAEKKIKNFSKVEIMKTPSVSRQSSFENKFIASKKELDDLYNQKIASFNNVVINGMKRQISENISDEIISDDYIDIIGDIKSAVEKGNKTKSLSEKTSS
jgi:hypothetical protein